MAFEAIIHSHPGRAGNGNKRVKFFKEILGSELVNDEVLRLFRLRCDAFKEGRSSRDIKKTWNNGDRQRNEEGALQITGT